MPLSAQVLIAVPGKLQEPSQQMLDQAGFSLLTAEEKEEALVIIRTQAPDAIIMISDWALDSAQGTANGLMEAVKGDVPTVSLISNNTWQHVRERWFDSLYRPPLHEYCSLPADREALMLRLERTIRASEI